MNRGLKWTVLGLVFGTPSCFMGYDSRWGQQKQAQQHAAAHETPPQLRRQSAEESEHTAQRRLKLRVYASPAYAATVTNWQKQFGDLLECVNAALTIARRQTGCPRVHGAAPDLSASEQATYARARSELAAGNAANARDIAAPLFQAHPASPELQSLRCDIAMRLGGDWDTILANGCQGLSPFESK